MSQSFFHLVFVFTFIGFILIRAFYHRKAQLTAGKVEFKEGRRATLVRMVVGIPYILLLFAYMVYPPLLARAAFSLPQWAQWVGVVLSLAALPLILWVQWALGSNFSTRLHVREEHTLVTHGPYRWVRHPMYTVLVIQALGLLLLTANGFLGGVYWAALAVVILVRMHTEEAAMIEKFGEDYRLYMRTTGRFLPRLGRSMDQV